MPGVPTDLGIQALLIGRLLRRVTRLEKHARDGEKWPAEAIDELRSEIKSIKNIMWTVLVACVTGLLGIVATLSMLLYQALTA